MTNKEWLLDTKIIRKSIKSYAHFDCRTDIAKCRHLISDPDWVSQHGFYPFIHYEKQHTKYNGNSRKKECKTREICYASHIDRCIYQYYCHILDELYIQKIHNLAIDDVPVAYRTDLGLNNIHIAKRAFDFIKDNQNAVVMIGDYTSFFDRLDHKHMKQMWCNLLGVEILPPDHYAIYKNICRYSTWELEDLLALNGLPNTGKGRRKLNLQNTVLSQEQFKEYRSHIKKHVVTFGIPQGSPISALLANVYMIDTDMKIKTIVEKYHGMYMRYSDDFIVILPINEDAAKQVIQDINAIIFETPGLELEPRKTQIYKYDEYCLENVGKKFFEQADISKSEINFLGFTFNGKSITLRSKTVSKYYYRMYRKAKSIKENPEKKGKDHLYKKYSERGAKRTVNRIGNFFTYVNQAQKIFGKNEHIEKPVKNHMSKIKKALKK